VALGDFYEALTDLIDGYAEAYMGQHGMIDGYTGMYKSYADPIEMLDDYAAYIEQNRDQIHDKKDTCLANIIDEIMALLDQTAYKIRFLK
jgi:DNA-binding ferritin-like protein